MKRLPVPPLPQTMQRYLATVAPLLDDEQLAATGAAVRAFEDGDGPACQEALERFAEEEAALGRNWMSVAWLAGYFATRGVLPLTSNVAFQLNWDADTEGLALAADVAHRFAAVSLRYLRGEEEPEVSPRGDQVCEQQRLFLAGGVRDPQPDRDEYLPGPAVAAGRRIVVLDRGRAWSLAVSDAEGQPMAAAVLCAALQDLRELAPAEGVPFAAPAYLDNEDAAAILSELRRDPGNAGVYEELRDALFVLQLTDETMVDEEHLERLAFAGCQGWPFKTLSVQVSLSRDRFVGISMEHSIVDGATLQSTVGRALSTSQLEAGSAQAADVSPLAWALSAAQVRRLAHGLARHEERSSAYRFRILRIPTGPVPPLPFKLSHDAGMQLVMIYAQLATYGRLRSTYESVDMREYEAGRTECLRPNTAAAVACAEAMVRGEATVELLRDALEAHRALVKVCKAGQSIDRHLFGLALMATREGWEMPILDDPAYAMLTTDFLSTTSLGEPTKIVRAAFAPTSVGGIGINYTPLEGVYEFCLNYVEDEAEHVDEFADALSEGVRALWDLLERASRDVPADADPG